MTEGEYIRASDLARIRAMLAISRELSDTNAATRDEVEALRKTLRSLERQHERWVGADCNPR